VPTSSKSSFTARPGRPDMRTANGNPRASLKRSILAVGRKHWLVATALIVGLIIGAAAGADGSAESLRSQLERLRIGTTNLIGDLKGQNSRLTAESSESQARLTEVEAQLREAKATQPLPNFMGQLGEEATLLAEDRGWSITVREKESAEVARTVLSQNPRPGTVMSFDAPFTIVIAKPFPPKLPSLVGKTLKQAKVFAESHGWKLVVRREISSRAPGTIIRQSPTPGTFMLGSGTLTVIVAKKAPVESAGGGNCHPSYQGQCLRPDASDYDCAGGSGNGPYYVYGTVRVVGPDVFDLDRDGDGYGCE
jgi:hypothetical protein